MHRRSRALLHETTSSAGTIVDQDFLSFFICSALLLLLFFIFLIDSHISAFTRVMQTCTLNLNWNLKGTMILTGFYSPNELGMYSIVFLQLLVKLDVDMRVLDIWMFWVNQHTCVPWKHSQASFSHLVMCYKGHTAKTRVLSQQCYLFTEGKSFVWLFFFSFFCIVLFLKISIVSVFFYFFFSQINQF